MKRMAFVAGTLWLIGACSSATLSDSNSFEQYEELDSTGLVEPPGPVGGRFAPADKDAVDRGRYLVVLLGCGACHTNGAFEGARNNFV